MMVSLPPAPANDIVVAAATLEGLKRRKRVVAAVERVVGGRAPDRADIRECIVANRCVAIHRTRGDVSRNRRRRVEIDEPGRCLPQRGGSADDDVVAAATIELVQAVGYAGKAGQAGKACGIEYIRKAAANRAFHVDERI